MKITKGMVMKRRDFLRHSLRAAATAAMAYPVGRGVFIVGSADDLETELAPELSREEQEDIAVSKLMDKYHIPNFEQAKELRSRMIDETSIYYAGGALIGSIYRSARNELNPQSSREFFHRAVSVLAGGGVALLASYPVKCCEQALHTNTLRKPETLINEYGMPANKANEFSDKYNEILSDRALTGAVSAALLQEFFIGPPKDKSGLNVQKNDARVG